MKRIGDFVIKQELANPAGGVVRYLSCLPGSDTPVVLQLVRVSASEEAFTRAANELKALHRVRSPHVIPLLHAGRHDGHLYTVVPFYPEGSLASPGATANDDTTALGDSTALDISVVADAGLGVHDLHEHGIVHRDIRPESIMRSEGRGLVAELGLIAVLTPGATTTGFGPIGTLDYTDPQLLLGQRAGRSTDIWSLGATLHHVCTKESIWPGAQQLSAAAAIRRLVDSRPTISVRTPTPLRAVIERALEPDPRQRFASAAEFSTAVREVLPQLNGSTQSADVPPLFTMRSS